MPEPELNPDRGRSRLDRVVGPDGRAAVDEVLHPGRRAWPRRLDHARREPEGHGRLQLQQAVEDPEAAEADAEDPPGGRLGRRAAPEGNACWPVLALSSPVLHGPDDVEGDRGRPARSTSTTRSWWKSVGVEGRDDQRVARSGATDPCRAWLPVSLGRPVGPCCVHCTRRLQRRVGRPSSPVAPHHVHRSALPFAH